jgi:hypothetical protein
VALRHVRSEQLASIESLLFDSGGAVVKEEQVAGSELLRLSGQLERSCHVIASFCGMSG